MINMNSASYKEFLSTPSVRRATFPILDRLAPALFLSTPSVRRATDSLLQLSLAGLISIHALRTEGDTVCRAAGRDNPHFYPRPPYGGRHLRCCGSFRACSISIHALRTEGDLLLGGRYSRPDISIHALRTEGDDGYKCAWCRRYGFLSTPSVRRATAKVHKILFAFAAQTRKFVVLILQNTYSLLLSKLFRALLHHFSTIFWCEGPSAFLCASCSHPLQQQHIIL